MRLCVWYARVKRAGLLMRELFFMLFAALAVTVVLNVILLHRSVLSLERTSFVDNAHDVVAHLQFANGDSVAHAA